MPDTRFEITRRYSAGLLDSAGLLGSADQPAIELVRLVSYESMRCCRDRKDHFCSMMEQWPLYNHDDFYVYWGATYIHIWAEKGAISRSGGSPQIEFVNHDWCHDGCDTKLCRNSYVSQVWCDIAGREHRIDDLPAVISHGEEAYYIHGVYQPRAYE